jgi:hypothetical protein
MTALDFRLLLIIHIVKRAFRQQQFLEPLPRLGRGIAEKYPSCFGSGALPGVRGAAWHECTGARAANRDLVANLEGNLATQDVGDLVAVVVKMYPVVVPEGAVSSNIITLSAVSPLSSLSATDLPSDLSHMGP